MISKKIEQRKRGKLVKKKKKRKKGSAARTKEVGLS